MRIPTTFGRLPGTHATRRRYATFPLPPPTDRPTEHRTAYRCAEQNAGVSKHRAKTYRRTARRADGATDMCVFVCVYTRGTLANANRTPAPGMLKCIYCPRTCLSACVLSCGIRMRPLRSRNDVPPSLLCGVVYYCAMRTGRLFRIQNGARGWVGLRRQRGMKCAFDERPVAVAVQFIGLDV